MGISGFMDQDRNQGYYIGICDRCGIEINPVDRILLAPDNKTDLARIDMVRLDKQYVCVPCYKEKAA